MEDLHNSKSMVGDLTAAQKHKGGFFPFVKHFPGQPGYQTESKLSLFKGKAALSQEHSQPHGVMKGYSYTDEYGSFHMENPECSSYLYFPLAGESGLKSGPRFLTVTDIISKAA